MDLKTLLETIKALPQGSDLLAHLTIGGEKILPLRAGSLCRLEQEGFKGHGYALSLDTSLEGITSNSAKIGPGFGFVALKGHNFDGINYISEAFARGAVWACAASDSAAELKKVLPSEDFSRVIFTPKPELFLLLACYAFYRPLPNYLTMVTGTNGKTSICTFISQILQKLGVNSLQIGTTGTYKNAQLQEETSLTTPAVSDLLASLYQAKQEGVDFAALEASSEGLAQGRLDGLTCKAAVFTNLTQDHLNFHKSMEEYFRAKVTLFTKILDPQGVAIVNSESEWGERLYDWCKRSGLRVLSYGEGSAYDASYHILSVHAGTAKVLFSYKGTTVEVKMPFAARFQLSNLCAAMCAVLEFTGQELEALPPALEGLSSPKGRVELHQVWNGAPIYIDYAHTPAALEEVLKALQALKESPKARLVLVFGCGGQRDIQKRAQMGRIASIGADHTYITDDNPREEDAAVIRRQIAEGFAGRSNYTIVASRREAVAAAVKSLRPGDLLLLAGKGHETYQIIGKIKHHSDDRELVDRAINQLVKD